MGAAVAAVAVQYQYSNNGTITISPGLDLYLNGTLQENNTVIEWGECAPGYINYFENMTVVNTGNTPLTVSISAEGIPSGWTLTWTPDNPILAPGDKAKAQLELYIPLSATEWLPWSFNLIGKQT